MAPGKAPQTYVGFDYAGADVQFLKTMPPVTGGKGHFSLMDNRLVVAVDEGVVTADEGGDVRLGASSFIIPDVRVRDGAPAVVRLEAEASVTAALSLLNRAPLNVMDKANLPVDLAGGRAALSGQIALPLKKGSKDKVVFDVSGKLRDVSSSVLVKGRALSAPEIDVVVDNDRVILTGAGELDGAGFDGSFVLPIGAGGNGRGAGDSRVARGGQPGSGGAGRLRDRPAARDCRGADKGATGGGPAEGPRAGVRSAIRSAGAAPVGAATELGQTPASAGKLRVTGQLGATPRVDRLAISGPGLSAEGAVRLREGGALDRLSFDRLRAGEWLDAAVDIVGQGAGKPVQVVLRGGVLDMRQADLGSGGGGGAQASGPPGPPMQVRLDRLQITDTIALTDLRGNFGTAGAGRFLPGPAERRHPGRGADRAAERTFRRAADIGGCGRSVARRRVAAAGGGRAIVADAAAGGDRRGL
ncbi:DUF3971 domain-containing protein [Sulfitobacter porphyrae]|uniref:DUF3971 domain-containing protein n=1 Tax=Sulfitobacter porphyrae TaxID=1246864 RepID=A0ABW2B3H1_9RHOB